MLSRPDEQTLAALSRLNAHTDFHRVLTFLQENLSDLDKKNRLNIGETIYKTQGAALVLDAILELSRNASKDLQKRKEVR